MKKILILSVFPAPYRAQNIKYFEKHFYVDSYFERVSDSNRVSEWFVKETKILLDKNTFLEFSNNIKNIKKYDAVVLFDYTSANSIKIIRRCKKFKIPYFINCDGVILGKKKNRFKEIIKKILLSKVSGCFASGKYAKEYFMNLGVDEEKIKFHPFTTLEKNDLSLSNLGRDPLLRKELNYSCEQNIFLAVGRFFSVKNYEWLIKNWPANETQQLILIGGGEQTSLYKELIFEREIKNIKIFEYLGKEEITRFYKMCDFFIHPTLYDAWGLVVNEAMANGAIVVSSNKCIAGLELIQDGKNGFIFDPSTVNLKNFVQTLCELKSSQRDFIRSNAFKTISEYTIENMAAAQIKFIIERIGE